MSEPKTVQRRINFRKANRQMPRRRHDIPADLVVPTNPELLTKFTTETGKILPRRVTGCFRQASPQDHQRDQTIARDQPAALNLRRGIILSNDQPVKAGWFFCREIPGGVVIFQGIHARPSGNTGSDGGTWTCGRGRRSSGIRDRIDRRAGRRQDALDKRIRGGSRLGGRSDQSDLRFGSRISRREDSGVSSGISTGLKAPTN